jgi:hypothetical protein
VFATVCVKRQGLVERLGIDMCTHDVWVELFRQYVLCFCHFEFDYSAEQVVYKHIYYHRIVYSSCLVAKRRSWPALHLQFVVFFSRWVCSGRCRTVAHVALVVLITFILSSSMSNLQHVNHVRKTV